jgi:hypothetical protein
MTEVQAPADGRGPLLERDYWAVVGGVEGPRALARVVAERFAEFPPPSLVRFRRKDGAQAAGQALERGDELDVDIIGAGTFGVRVIHRDANSITLATLAGHPEAGRITFGAYRNRWDDVVFHIRSRARAGSRSHYAGFLFAGDPMQTNTWSDFINRLAAAVGDGVEGMIHAEKQRVHEERGDREVDAPTFIAEGD